MDRVVVVDSDSEHALVLKAHLEDAGCLVEICSNVRLAPVITGRQDTHVAVLVHQSPTWWRTDLRSFCDAVARLDRPPAVICLLRWPSQGPSDRLYGDELKVTMFHEE